MGGSETTEYLALSEAGEDEIVICPACGYAANAEVATYGEHVTSNNAVLIGQTQLIANQRQPIEPRAIVATPNCATIADVAGFMGVAEAATAKAVFFDSPERGLLFVVIRGDREVSEAKLRIAAGVSALTPATAEQIVAAGAVPGYASPVGLAIQNSEDRQSGIVVLADHSITTDIALVAGANQVGYHYRNVVYGRDWHATQVADLAAVRVGDPCPQCATGLTIERGIEIGHIFQLGTRYAEALGATFLDQNGVAQPVVMGSYGIGLERLLHVIIEQHHDPAGIIWPQSIAPFQAHLIRLGKSEAARTAADTLYQELGAQGISVLYDDRDESPGVKFNDADLIGLPVRLLISDRMLAEGVVEVKPRAGAAIKVARDAIVGYFR
jgi:prolyl-tRNA synthetase